MEHAVETANTAFEARRWQEALEAFSALDQRSELSDRDLERLAAAAQLVGDDELAASTWERAHVRHVGRGDIARAARCAFWAGFGLMNSGQWARAGGWIGRGRRLLDEHALDCAEQGFLLVPVALRTLESGDPEAAHTLFSQVIEIGHRFGEPDLLALGRLGQGRSLVLMGRETEGLELLDEAMVAVTADALTPIIAGRIYCAVILICHRAFDLDRAHQWTAALASWCDGQPDLVPFRGQCLVHRSEVLQWHGDWSQALDEAERARDRLSHPSVQPAIGLAFYQLGELYRLRGDFVQAEAAYREASNHGQSTQPGLALLRLAQGDVDTAVAAVQRVLEGDVDRVTRARVLGAAVEILLEAGEGDAASRAAEQLREVAAAISAPLLDAMASHAAAAVALWRGDARYALDAAQRAAAAWGAMEAPYELARSRLLVAAACAGVGDADTAQLETRAAATAFARLGALPDLERAHATLEGDRDTGDTELTPRQIEVLSLVAAGRTNRQIADELYVSEHTVRRHLQNIFTRIGVSSRAAATAYAYEHELI